MDGTDGDDRRDDRSESDCDAEVARAAAAETLAALSRSPARLQVLERVLDDATTATELADELPVSRRTVTRALATLQEEGLVDAQGRTYDATPTAAVVGPHVLSVVDRLDRADDLGAFLSRVPDDALDIDPAVLDGRVTRSDPVQPHAPDERAVELVEEGDDLRILAPLVSSMYLETLRDRVLDGGASVEVIVTGAVRDRLCSSLLAAVRPVVAGHDVSLHAHDGDARMAILLREDLAAIGVTGEDNTTRILLESEAPAVLEWASDRYEAYREEAEPVL